jgi:UDP-N-acetylglucosamine 3-dehydrogenase
MEFHMVRVGILGAGYIGRIHAQILHTQIDQAKVAVVSDTVKEKGQALASDLGVPFYQDCYDVIESDEIDAVVISTPTPTHAEYFIAAAENQKHIFCEKPLAVSLIDADKMIHTFRKHKLKAMSGHVLRFWPVYVKAKKIVDSGELGHPIHGYCERLLAFPDWIEGDWHKYHLQGGSAALEVQIHDLDYLTWIFGTPVKIRSDGIFNEKFGGWSHMNSHIAFMNGLYGNVHAGWGLPSSYPFTVTLRIVCEKGTVEWNFSAGKLLEQRDHEAPLVVYKNDSAHIVEEIDRRDPYFLQWRYFIDCIEHSQDIKRATLEDGRTALQLALASIESAKEKKEVALDIQ